MSANSKHRDRQFYLARGVFGLAALILIGLVAWVAVRAGGPAAAGETPVLVQPSADLQAVESTVVPLPAKSDSPSPSPSASPSASASASATPSKSSASPKPSKSSSSPKPSASRTTTPPPAIELAATCSTNSWGGGFITTVKVTNKSTKASNFSVSVSYSAGAKVVSGPWSNAKATTTSGSQLRFKGNSALNGGATTTFAFQGENSDRNNRGNINQTGCSVAVAAG